MRLYSYTTRWQRVAAAVTVLIICGVLLPLLVMSYLDKKTFAPTKPQETVSLSENEKIRQSVRGETLDLGKKRMNIKSEMETLLHDGETAKENITREQNELNRVASSMSQATRSRRDFELAPEEMLRDPLGLPDVFDTKPAPEGPNVRHCSYEECFDYSRCSLKKHFKVFFYPVQEDQLTGVDTMTRNDLSNAIRSNAHSTPNADEACIFVRFVSASVEKPDFFSLKYWNGDGANHIIVIIDNCTRSSCNHGIPLSDGKAIYARQTFRADQFREGFDIVIPPLQWSSGPLPYMLPLRRETMLSFSGTYVDPGVETSSGATLDTRYIHGEVINKFQHNTASKVSCFAESDLASLKAYQGAWVECEDDGKDDLSRSTFVLMVAPDEDYFASTEMLSSKIIRTIRSGAIPVILGDYVRLPFDSLLQWRRAAILLAKARAPELELILSTYSDEDLFTLKRQGRRIVETYFKTASQLIDTLLSSVRYKLKIQPLPEKSRRTDIVPNLNFGPVNQQLSSETDEALGPLETPYPSLAFQRNFSLTLNYWRDLFNVHFSPHNMAAWRPTDPVLPSDAKFKGSSFGFRPIGFGAGGSGKEFAEALGGNYPREQFTAVVLTYDRPQVLIEGISNFKGLPYLNKVLVVWNGPDTPGPETLTWPEIGVPVQVVKTRENSLNNRFVPWDAIETEAVLSLDDDARLRHDELIFAFRVWRENRDRIVGFPGRFHAFDLVNRQWTYNSNHSCELSMVLTGAAFFHKFYMHEYTHRMPAEIRQTVDELMNCEDIALNFLVAHLTRKTPLKVTSKWTFRCPGCPVALLEHDSHFLERHDCINKFSQLYGYNPLLYTQLRADSVLFKTRVPHDKQKCFKFI